MDGHPQKGSNGDGKKYARLVVAALHVDDRLAAHPEPVEPALLGRAQRGPGTRGRETRNGERLPACTKYIPRTLCIRTKEPYEDFLANRSFSRRGRRALEGAEIAWARVVRWFEDADVPVLDPQGGGGPEPGAWHSRCKFSPVSPTTRCEGWRGSALHAGSLRSKEFPGRNWLSNWLSNLTQVVVWGSFRIRGLVAQGIEQRFPKPRAEVRVLPGPPNLNTDRAVADDRGPGADLYSDSRVFEPRRGA